MSGLSSRVRKGTRSAEVLEQPRVSKIRGTGFGVTSGILHQSPAGLHADSGSSAEGAFPTGDVALTGLTLPSPHSGAATLTDEI